jgi:hypothetical protein
VNTLDILTNLIMGPVLFVLGAFFVMLPFVGVRVFGVVLMIFAASSGGLSYEKWLWETYLVVMILSGVAVASGAYLNYHLTDRRIKQLIEDNKKKVSQGKEILVPYCKDGTWFHPGLVYSDGLYRVGPKGGEQTAESYQQALQMLRDMPIACWRRPSPRSGLLGMVSAAHWGQPPLRYDRRQVVNPQPLAAQAA